MQSNLKLEHPVFFAGCARDHVCVAKPSEDILRQLCPNGTVKMFDTGHWVQLEAPGEVNRALLAWIVKVVPARK